MVELSIKEVYIDEFTNQVVVSVETSMRDSIIEYLNNEIDNFEDTTISFTNPINIVQTDASGKGIKANGTLTLGYNAYNPSTGEYGFITAALALTGHAPPVTHRAGEPHRLPT